MKDCWKKYLAELIGTFVLVVVGCGTAVGTGADVVATALAFGISIVILAYSVGRVSGGHVNPAVSLAMAIDGKLSWKDFCGYVCAQILGAIAGSALLGAFFKGYKATGANEVNQLIFGEGFGGMMLVFVVEMALTFLFVLTVLGVTADDKFSQVGGLVIGAALTGVHLVGIPLDGTSVNPARSLSAALFALIGGDSQAIKEIWIFLLAPLAGAALAALAAKLFLPKKAEEAK